MRINFIRHGKTPGNQEKRYIGTTDESLCAEGINEIYKIYYPDCDILLVSPMKRCFETAKLIYPDKNYIIEDSFRECCFGDFEGKNYCELSDDPRYQEWIDSGGTMRFPNGESPEGFRKRCINGFIRLVTENSSAENISLVVHGGTIMAVMESFAVPKKSFYDWHTSNGHGYITDFNGETITVLEII